MRATALRHTLDGLASEEQSVADLVDQLLIDQSSCISLVELPNKRRLDSGFPPNRFLVHSPNEPQISSLKLMIKIEQDEVEEATTEAI
jgi:hypothetical protein